jgi:DNA-binding response OmpR family regulator
VTGLLSTKYARQLMDEEVVDLLIVDRSLPGVEGSEFVALLREEGFERGGDDYMTKPFNMNELLLRVGAILRRTHAEPPERLHHRDIYLDMQHHTVMIGDREIDLSRLEFDLLRFFLLHPGADLSREALLDAVWGDHASARIATVNVTVNRLLDKIDPDRTQRYICSVRGVGYRLC